MAEILDVVSGVPSNRLEDLLELQRTVGGGRRPLGGGRACARRSNCLRLLHLEKSLVDVRGRGDQWRLFFDDSVASDPIKRISPAILLEPVAAALLQLFQEMNRGLQVASSPVALKTRQSPWRSERRRWEIGSVDETSGAATAQTPRTESSAQRPPFRQAWIGSKATSLGRQSVRRNRTDDRRTSHHGSGANWKNFPRTRDTSFTLGLDAGIGSNQFRPLGPTVRLKLSTFLNANLECKIAFSFSICSAR